MMRMSAALLAALLVAACSGPNTSLSTLQLSGDVVPFPENYQVEAARVVRDRGGDPKVALASYPQQTVGMGIMTPKLWYVCISGLADPAAKRDLPRVMDIVDQWVDVRARADRFYAVLLFSAEGRRPSVRTGTDSVLCRGVALEPITAEPPVT